MSGSTDMCFASAVSDRVDTLLAVKQAIAALEVPSSTLGAPAFVLVFASPQHASAFQHIAAWVRAALGETTVLGMGASGVIGAGTELEGREGLSITVAWLPDTRVRALHLSSLPREPKAMLEQLQLPLTASPHCLVFPDSGSCDVDGLLRGLDVALPNSKKVGGVMASERAAFFLGDRVLTSGALLCAIDGPCELTTVVTQGCRPIGEPFIVTRSRGHIIDELNVGKPADVLRDLRASLDDHDRALFDTALVVGVEMGDRGGRYEAGDFLVRNVLGVDRERGAMAIGARLSQYQVVQFHLRDGDAATRDLQQKLQKSGVADHDVRGALLFSCVGRGERMFGAPNHDSSAFIEHVGPVSLSGMFCNGEIGPVGGKTFQHGYTSVFGVFSQPK